MRTPHPRHSQLRANAFTLVELIVVVIVLAILLAVMLPNLFGASKDAQDASAKEYLTVVFKVAKLGAIANDGVFETGGALASTIASSEPELKLSTGTAAEACTLTDKAVMVSSDSTATGIVLYAHAANGTTWQLTATQSSAPQFSEALSCAGSAATPTAQQIAYLSAATNSVHLINADGTGDYDAESPAAPIVRPGTSGTVAWSPNGTKIAAIGGPTTSGPINVTTEIPCTSANQQQFPCVTPAPWSGSSLQANGATINTYSFAWVGNSQIAYADGVGYSPSVVHVINLDGSGDHSIGVTTDDAISASPDGSKITYHDPSSGDIMVVNADGSNAPGIDIGGGYSPAWNPSGTKIAFHYATIWTMNGDGSNRVNTGVPGTNATWSPSGTKIAFQTYDPVTFATTTIHTMNADGSNVADLGVVGTYPSW
jgi:prepilin-type N-terminal cleavage/methylation domain-containing protein